MGNTEEEEQGLALETPSSFGAFPYKPYDIQLDLMKHLYQSIESKSIAMCVIVVKQEKRRIRAEHVLNEILVLNLLRERARH